MGTVPKEGPRDWSARRYQDLSNILSPLAKEIGSLYGNRLRELHKAEDSTNKTPDKDYLRLELPVGFNSTSGDHRQRNARDIEEKGANAATVYKTIFMHEVISSLDIYVDHFEQNDLSKETLRAIKEALSATIDYYAAEFKAELEDKPARFAAAKTVLELKGIYKELEDELNDTIDGLHKRTDDIMRDKVKRDVDMSRYISP